MDPFNTGKNLGQDQVKVGDIITNGKSLAQFARVISIDQSGNLEVEYMSTNDPNTSAGIWQGDYQIEQIN